MPTIGQWSPLRVCRVVVIIKCDISKISGGVFWDEWRWYKKHLETVD